MFDYKKYLNDNDFSDNQLEVFHLQKEVEVFGTKKELLYLASCIMQYIEEDCADCDIAELNFDPGADLTSESSSLRFFLSKKIKKTKNRV